MLASEILTIGNELLNGTTSNSNAQYLADQLTKMGFEVRRQMSCLDQIDEIVFCMSEALERSHIVIVTGGLGPTTDDVTREAVAKYLGCDLEFDARQYRYICAYFKTLKRRTPYLTRQEAFFPQAATPILNRFGIALGFFVRLKGRLLIVLPGVPRELRGMFESSVGPLLLTNYKKRGYFSRDFKLTGISEPQVMRKLGRRITRFKGVQFGFYPYPGEVTVRISGDSKRPVQFAEKYVHRRLSKYLFGFGNTTFSKAIMALFIDKKKTLAAAESCTSGWLAKKLTDASGASQFFKGGVVVYSNESKSELLGIEPEIIHKKGAVSSEVARMMAEAVRVKFRSSLGISITGIAGPKGGTTRKPVGLVFIGLSDAKKSSAFEFRFPGERDRIREYAAVKAMQIVWDWIK